MAGSEQLGAGWRAITVLEEAAAEEEGIEEEGGGGAAACELTRGF